jgi:nicotinate-nucleotide adenylyltransferase
MRKERIGLLGGTFNPVHSGHLQAAAEVRQKFALDRVLFIPSFIPPHKQTAEMASPRDRFAMVDLAVRDLPGFAASAIEIEARETSYSIITLNKLKGIYPTAGIFFILGIDAFLEIETWRSYPEVLEQCHFIVISRPGYALAGAKNVLAKKDEGRFVDMLDVALVAEDLITRPRIFLTAIQALDISSTDIRRRIRESRSVAGLVPDAVESYIRRKKLYQR